MFRYLQIRITTHPATLLATLAAAMVLALVSHSFAESPSSTDKADEAKRDLRAAAATTAVSANADPVPDLPAGVIFGWLTTSVPQGWLLSDGTQGTLNLLDGYIKGTVDGKKLAQRGGTSQTTIDGGHTPSVSPTGGTWSLNTQGGATQFDYVPGHSHQVDPFHVEVGFITNTAEAASIPKGAIAFWEPTQPPTGWELYPKNPPTQSHLLLKGSKTPSPSSMPPVQGGSKTTAAGAHTPSITVGGGKLALNPKLGFARFDQVPAHSHGFTPEIYGLRTIRSLQETTVIPAGLIAPWSGAPAAEKRRCVLLLRRDTGRSTARLEARSGKADLRLGGGHLEELECGSLPDRRAGEDLDRLSPRHARQDS